MRRWIMRLIGAMLAILCLLLGLFLWRPGLLLGLPGSPLSQSQTLAPSSLILDQQGRLLYEIMDPHTGSHRPLAFAEIPLPLRQAIIATEDATFYHNPGVDPVAIARALWINWRSGEIRSGASTITQQVARNLLMPAEERHAQTWQRKARESLLAYYLTRTMTKDDILALYLNETYFGNLAFGVEAAARAYFGKPASQLDLAECALLAGLPQSPSAYNPLTNLPAAKQRQQVVLQLMVKAGYITAERADMAYREPLQFASAPLDIQAPHFCMLVREQLTDLLGEETLRRGGLRVYTTLALDLQRAAEAQVRRHLAQLNEPTPDAPVHNVHNAAVVVLDPHDGAVRVMVGSPDYFDPSIDGAVNATLALRQPGSAIKPVTYAAALSQGYYSPATVFADVRSSFTTREGRPYVPINYDYRYHGLVSLRVALASSYNVVAVKLLDEIGLDAFVSTGRALGLTTLDDANRYGLALTLGSCEVSLLQLASAYGAFANGGQLVQPRLVERVEDNQGRVLYQAAPPQPQQVLEERVAYLITDILSDHAARVPGFGESSPLELPFAAAVKTGTTTDWRDNWTIGYSTELVVGVWVGNADNQPMVRVSGVSGAAPIWNEVMRAAHPQDPARIATFTRPPGIAEVTVCAESGLLPTAACPHRKAELFLRERVPAQSCSLHRLVAFDTRTGQVADEEVPAEYRQLRRVTLWPAEALAWAEEEGLALPPSVRTAIQAGQGQPAHNAEASAQPNTIEAATPPLALTSPDHGSGFRLSPELPAEYQQIEVVASSPPEAKLQDVTLWIDGKPAHVWPAPPYRLLWPLTPGEHEFRVSGRNSQGTITSESVRITVYQGTVERNDP
ncbi:MAG: penicillin-binding protein 1C [Chloroflexi bacterium]|jgi:1A family penicillin-binding protein|nr:penicillin-binding protein 1C [Chloroflexota bacterium]